MYTGGWFFLTVKNKRCVICGRRIRTGYKYCFRHRGHIRDTPISPMAFKRKEWRETSEKDKKFYKNTVLIVFGVVFFGVLWGQNKLIFFLLLAVVLFIAYWEWKMRLKLRGKHRGKKNG
jgi:hypothetical protein